VPQTRYVQTADGIHIAYQVIGEGERDIVFVPGLMSHLELLWEDRETSDFFRQLSRLGRLIMFDKRDTGLSDRAPGDLSLEERMEDLRAVMQAAGSSQAVLFGYSEGAPMSLLFAATNPGRVTALILGSASARWFPAPGYPCGQGTEEMFAGLADIAAHRWGQGASIEWYMPSRAGSARMREAFGRFERMAINPSAFLRMMRMIREIDVRAVLPAIHVPTLVIQRLEDRITPPCHGRYLASHIAGARYFEQPGDHSLRFAASGNSEELYAEIADFLAGSSTRRDPDRVLATILHAITANHTTVVDHPMGWARPLTGSQGEDLVRAHRGHLVRTTADGILATFDAPGQAIRCAAAVRDETAAAGGQVRAGIHTGEVDMVGENIAGPSVQITAQVAALARPAEILVSRTVKDLVTGSGIIFTERGSYALNEPSDEWPLFAVTGFALSAAPDAPVRRPAGEQRGQEGPEPGGSSPAYCRRWSLRVVVIRYGLRLGFGDLTDRLGGGLPVGRIALDDHLRGVGLRGRDAHLVRHQLPPSSAPTSISDGTAATGSGGSSDSATTVTSSPSCSICSTGTRTTAVRAAWTKSFSSSSSSSDRRSVPSSATPSLE
jgi:pimeloyl-ACP methyl ester carboxylesterase